MSTSEFQSARPLREAQGSPQGRVPLAFLLVRFLSRERK
ncbi:MAG: hypothetical protein [Olavius algarvensis Delta 4 endosymbiont]|nr:MAG: hypothetical protein [Olavius algarvensis Delta 4 endosymbiont]